MRGMLINQNQLIIDRTEVLVVDDQPIVSPDIPEMTLNYFTPDGVTTVSTYRSRILKKMGMKNNAELTRYALDNGLTYE